MQSRNHLDKVEMSSGKKSGLAQCRSLLDKVINQRASVKKIEITFLFLEFSHGKIYRKRAFLLFNWSLIR